MRNTATTVAAQNISSVKWQGGDGIDEGSADPSDNNQCHEEPPDGGS